MTIFVFIIVGIFLIFALGVMCGASWTEQLMTERSRRQAAIQRRINDQWRELRECEGHDDRR